jgi:hypothetical protein
MFRERKLYEVEIAARCMEGVNKSNCMERGGIDLELGKRRNGR